MKSSENGLTDGTGRIWIVSEMYYPEETSTAHFLTRIAEGLASEFPVGALCAQPTYSRRGVRGPRREVHNGVEILRCPSTTLNKDVLLFKLVNTITISLSLFLYTVWVLRGHDIILVATNPPILPFVVLIACKLRKATCVLLLQDAYLPDGLIAVGLAKPGSVAVRLMDMLNRWLFKNVARVCVLGRDMADLVRKKIKDRDCDRIVIIRNWADLDTLRPEGKADNVLLGELNLTNKFVLQFAGNMGRMYGIEMLFEAACLLQESDPDVHFLFIGFGAKRRWLGDAVETRGLANVTLVGSRPRTEQQIFLNACDVAITAFVPGMLGVGVPSRTYNILAVGKPLIAAVDDASEIALVIREESVGWVVPPNRPDLFVEVVREARADPMRLAGMGRRGREAAETKYAFSVARDAYRTLVTELAETGPQKLIATQDGRILAR